MIKHDLSRWPLVVSVSRGAPTLEELRRFSDDWTRWFARNERFATLRIHVDAQSHTHPEGGAKEKKRWFTESRDDLKSLIIGMATVVPAEILGEVGRTKQAKLYGVPAQAFESLDDAVDWLASLFSAEGAPCDPKAVRAKTMDMIGSL